MRVAWNNNSNYIQLEAGQLAIYNGSLDLTNGVLCSMVRGRTGQSCAMVLSEQLAFLRRRSITLHGPAQISESDIIYTTKWTYVQDGQAWENYAENTLHAGCDVDMHYYTLKNVNFEGGGITGTLKMVQPLEINSDGTLQRWSNGCKLQFQNGILVSGTWYG